MRGNLTSVLQCLIVQNLVRSSRFIEHIVSQGDCRSVDGISRLARRPPSASRGFLTGLVATP